MCGRAQIVLCQYIYKAHLGQVARKSGRERHNVTVFLNLTVQHQFIIINASYMIQ